MSLRGLVLAGGKSRRFGQDKALVMYQGKTLLERAVGLLESMDLRPLVVTREEADYSFLSCPILTDKLPDQGPLGGIYTAMSWHKNTDFLVLTCDMPSIEKKTLEALFEPYNQKQTLTLFEWPDGKREPFPGIYPQSTFSFVSDFLLKEKLSMKNLIDSVADQNRVPIEGENPHFFNINTVTHFEELLS